MQVNSLRVWLLATLATLGCVPAAAGATTYVYEADIALNPSQSLPNGYSTGLPGAPITLGIGDTLQGTILFTNGSLAFSNSLSGTPEQLFLRFSAANPDIGASTTLDLLGLQGQYNYPNPMTDAVYGNGVIGPSAYNPTNSTFSFTGLSFSFTINSILGASSLSFSPYDFQLYGGPAAIIPASAVPEPDTWALMFLGLMAIGGGIQRRKRTIAQIA